jgi:hypothetical protein
MITASGDSHHWRSLKLPACTNLHYWRLCNVAHQCCFPLYIRVVLSKFSKSRRETKRRRQAAKNSHRAPPSSPTAAAPPTTPPSSRNALPTSTSAPLSSARAPPLLPVVRRRLPLGPRLFSRGPPQRCRPRAPHRPPTSSPSAATPLPSQDDVFLSAGHFPNRRPGTAVDSSAAADSVVAADSSATPARHRRLISSPRLLVTHGGRGWDRWRSDDRPGSVCFFLFSKCNYMCIIFNYGLWIVDK